MHFWSSRRISLRRKDILDHPLDLQKHVYPFLLTIILVNSNDFRVDWPRLDTVFCVFLLDGLLSIRWYGLSLEIVPGLPSVPGLVLFLRLGPRIHGIRVQRQIRHEVLDVFEENEILDLALLPGAQHH